MTLANSSDYAFVNTVFAECDQPELTKEQLDACLVYVGEHGVCLLDPQDRTNAIVHVSVLPQGRGKWAYAFFKRFLAWAFTETAVERINAGIPVWAVIWNRLSYPTG